MKEVVVNTPPITPDYEDYVVGIQRWQDASRERATTEPLIHRRRKIEFDPDSGPDSVANQGAARAYGLRWNESSGSYEDRDGCPMRDRFGQPL